VISSLKFFHLKSSAMIALYGNQQKGNDRWQCNLPAEEIVLGDPSALPAEQGLPSVTASRLVSFTLVLMRRMSPLVPALR
jgi:hypothetical protein